MYAYICELTVTSCVNYIRNGYVVLSMASSDPARLAAKAGKYNYEIANYYLMLRHS